MLIAGGVLVYEQLNPAEVAPESIADPSSAEHGDRETGTQDFQCEGKTHCSQMRSCGEATFYLQNCPNTEMDGNGDGVPCESQWCG